MSQAYQGPDRLELHHICPLVRKLKHKLQQPMASYFPLSALAKRYFQLEPTLTKFQNQKLHAGGQTVAANSNQLGRKPFNCLTMTAQSPKNNKQLGESWLRWPNSGELHSSWAKV